MQAGMALVGMGRLVTWSREIESSDSCCTRRPTDALPVRRHHLLTRSQVPAAGSPFSLASHASPHTTSITLPPATRVSKTGFDAQVDHTTRARTRARTVDRQTDAPLPLVLGAPSCNLAETRRQVKHHDLHSSTRAVTCGGARTQGKTGGGGRLPF